MFAPCSFKEECSNLRLSFAAHLWNDYGQMDILINPINQHVQKWKFRGPRRNKMGLL